jgi:hypothetical protein
MVQLTTQFDSHIKILVRKLEMLWTVTLNDGTKIYSDYERDKNPFDKVKEYCTETGLYPVEVKSMMFGAPETVMFSNPDGLDGLFILRGSVKDVDLNSADNSISYKKLVVGVLNKDTNTIDVKKFCWPENEIDSNRETRKLTLDNLEMMYFKNGEEKNKLKSLLLSDNG